MLPRPLAPTRRRLRSTRCSPRRTGTVRTSTPELRDRVETIERAAPVPRKEQGRVGILGKARKGTEAAASSRCSLPCGNSGARTSMSPSTGRPRACARQAERARTGAQPPPPSPDSPRGAEAVHPPGLGRGASARRGWRARERAAALAPAARDDRSYRDRPPPAAFKPREENLCRKAASDGCAKRRGGTLGGAGRGAGRGRDWDRRGPKRPIRVANAAEYGLGAKGEEARKAAGVRVDGGGRGEGDGNGWGTGGGGGRQGKRSTREVGRWKGPLRRRPAGRRRGRPSTRGREAGEAAVSRAPCTTGSPRVPVRVRLRFSAPRQA